MTKLETVPIVMQQTFEGQCEKIRTRIERSRRSMDRQLVRLTSPSHHLAQVNHLATTDLSSGSLVAAIIGYFLARWSSGSGRASSAEHQLLGQAAAATLQRLIRHVVDWVQSTRHEEREADEETDDA